MKVSFVAIPTLAIMALAAAPGVSVAQTPSPIVVTTKDGTALEARGKEQLERLVQEYDIDRWLFTKEVLVESRVIPHSHPVLTVNTQYVGHDRLQLATFLHEQFHWFEELNAGARASAIRDFRERFPNVPDRSAGGARDEESTYLHLIVCDLEFQALTQLFGEEEARAIIGGWDHYSWVYDQVLNEPDVRRINERHGLVAP